MRRLLILVALLAAPAAFAADVRLSWTAPTTCEDGSALTNCPTTGFEVSESAAATGQPWGVRETVAGTATTRTYVLPPGQRCFQLRTVAGTSKSGPSNTACADVPSLPPKAPQGVTVTVQVTVSTP
jgi:hypothetical protein